MGRGRPKGSKNKSKTISTNLFTEDKNTTEKPTLINQKTDAETKDLADTNIKTLEEETTKKTTVKIPKIIGYCDKCHKPIYTSFINANLSHLTGKATWHRECSLDRLSLCSDCGAALNTLIDNWILKDNPQYKKFSLGNS